MISPLASPLRTGVCDGPNEKKGVVITGQPLNWEGKWSICSFRVYLMDYLHSLVVSVSAAQIEM